MPCNLMAGRARFTAGAALVTAVFALTGCGSGGPEVVPVSGTVTIDGKPLTYGYVQVLPTNWRPAGGRLGGDGRFTLTTKVNGDGCAVGTHAVAILSSESLTPETTKWHAPKEYADGKTSNLTVTITGPTDDLKIELKGGGKEAPKVNWEGGSEFAK